MLDTNILRDQMTVRRLRLAAGLIMLCYLTLHFIMHALGNVSLEAMQWGTRIHDFVWHSTPGTIVLYGAFAIHFTLALYALYARRSFRMGAGELVRLLLGFSILPLLLHHFAAGRYVYSAFDVTRRYDVVLTVYFSFVPFWGWRQVTVLLVAWSHGCLGVHYWLRARSSYHRFATALLTSAVLLPVLALLGIWQGARQVLAQWQLHPDWLQMALRDGHVRDPSVNGPSWNLEVQLYWIYIVLLALVFVAWAARWLVERRRGLINVVYPGGRVVRVPVGYPLLDASRRAGIPHAAICGGRGRCTTCRIRVLRGADTLPPPSASEQAVLARLLVGPSVRLACQLRPRRDIAVLPLLPPDISASESRQRDYSEVSDIERFVAIMFVDIRNSTALVEKRLPYDVVFLLNHFFDAVAGAVADTGGMPNQFLGDGMMAIFGTHAGPREACSQALGAAQLIHRRLGDMNRTLADELPEPIAIGVGLHAGSVILGELGYRDRFLLTAIGDSVHVAARLQDLTKDYGCQLVVSDIVAVTAGVEMGGFPVREVSVRGRAEPLAVRIVGVMDELVA
ncbi:MAG: adenylate/guanylate cyclase domain-containing protein [Pseudolabrys sp.]